MHACQSGKKRSGVVGKKKEEWQAVGDLSRSTKGGSSRIWKVYTECLWYVAPAEINVAQDLEPHQESVVFKHDELNPV